MISIMMEKFNCLPDDQGVCFCVIDIVLLWKGIVMIEGDHLNLRHDKNYYKLMVAEYIKSEEGANRLFKNKNNILEVKRSWFLQNIHSIMTIKTHLYSDQICILRIIYSEEWYFVFWMLHFPCWAARSLLLNFPVPFQQPSISCRG